MPYVLFLLALSSATVERLPISASKTLVVRRERQATFGQTLTLSVETGAGEEGARFRWPSENPSAQIVRIAGKAEYVLLTGVDNHCAVKVLRIEGNWLRSIFDTETVSYVLVPNHDPKLLLFEPTPGMSFQEKDRLYSCYRFRPTGLVHDGYRVPDGKRGFRRE